MSKRIFLDYASITPVDKIVSKKMKELENSANPSALYEEGIEAKNILEESRQNIAGILNCQKKEIIFTSGGTEGNNLALLGVFEVFRTKNFTPHFVTTMIEHSSVLEVFKEIERRGGEVTYVEVSEEGIVNPKDIAEALKKNTVLVSIMYANNEIGTIQPIKEIGKVIKEYKLKNNYNKIGISDLDAVQGGRRNERGGVLSYDDENILPSNEEMRQMRKSYPYFHTDACQAAQYLSLDVQKLGVDMMTLDGIKMYGPRGGGLLYVKEGINLYPIIFGGGQEKKIRSGTENIPAIVGLALALKISQELKEKETERLKGIRDYGTKEILKTFPKAILNGSLNDRLPNNINVCFPELDAEFAVISLDVAGIACSYSSSCQTLKENSSSYVVSALGREQCSESSLRFTLGRESSKKDIDELIFALKKIVIE